MTDTVLALFGPTASGKTAVAQAIAERIPAELVSADSMQVYRGLPILTNQSPARLVGIWPLDHEASVAEYQELAHAAIDEILAAGRTPVVVGGTGLYLRAALADLTLPPAPEPGERERWERFYDEQGAERAHERLAELDPEAAAAVHPNDRRRVVRSLELSGGSASATSSGPARPGTRRSCSASMCRKRSSTVGSPTARGRCSRQGSEPRRSRARGPISPDRRLRAWPLGPRRATRRRGRNRALAPARGVTRRTSASGCGAFRALLACLPIALRARSPMQFSKWHGLGNDYLLVERAELAFPLTPERVQKLCDYHFGVGSDGIVEVLSTNGDSAEVVIWNPDGSTAELSGNGTRIAARWLARRNGSSGHDQGRPREVVATMREDKLVETEMGAVEVGEREQLHVEGKQYEMVPVAVGNPHAVIRHDPDHDEFLQLGPAIENHERFPTGRTCSSRTSTARTT